VHRSRVKAAAKDTLVVGDPGAQAMFDDRVYKRGALALHCVRNLVGDEPFFDALRAWVAEFRHSTVTTQGFVEFFENHTGNRDIGAVVDLWIYRVPVPALISASATT
jgi:aminopeptidase N